MRKSKFVVAIIGNGKLSKCLVLGLLRKNFLRPHQIIVIGRNLKKLSWFQERGVRISTEMQDVAVATHVFLMVSPDGSGDILARLEVVNLQPLYGYEIISLVSGLKSGHISNVIPPNVHHRIITATCNTSIAYGCGIICATEHSVLFENLGEVIIEKDFSMIVQSIVTVGSLSAFHCVALDMSYTQGASVNLTLWLQRLTVILEKFNFSEKIKDDDEYFIVKKYLIIIYHVLRHKRFGFSHRRAIKRVRMTIKSVVESLRIMSITAISAPIEALKVTVVTKNGCTEKGVNSILTKDDLLSLTHMEKQFFLVLDKDLTFEEIADTSVYKKKKKTSTV